MNRLVCAMAILTLPWCLTGCKKSNSSDPDLVKVSGTVNLDGKAMAGGEIRFSVPGKPVKTLEIKDGTFSGEVFVGKNLVGIVWDKDGPPNPTDPSTRVKVNAVAPNFSGPNSSLNADIGADGSTTLKFDVTSARR